jgi:hypothetical protein
VKRAIQFALLALLVAQPALSGFACAPLAGSSIACATSPSSPGQLGNCPKIPTLVAQDRDSCCYIDSSDSTQQALVDRSAQDQRMGQGVIEEPPRMAQMTQLGLEPDRVPRVPLRAASLQTLYCSFLI